MSILIVDRSAMRRLSRMGLRCRRFCATQAKQKEEGRKEEEPEESQGDSDRMSEEELEQMRERQRWQDRYEFADDEIEEELRREQAWKERYREARNWLRYHLNIFEEHDNLTERRERLKIINWKDIRVKKWLIGCFVLALIIYTDYMRQRYNRKLYEFQSRGGGADWPTHYINLKEIVEGRRSLNDILGLWETIRDVHQRDWLLPLLMGQALMNQIGNPPIMSLPNPSNSAIDRLAEELAFVEADVARVSAEVALHLYNLKSGDVKWPGRPPNSAVLREMDECIECMATFRVHPALAKRLEEQKREQRNFYGGTGYFQTTTGALAEKTVSA
eukprot:TRINITY_DN26927_c0_g1_i1.p1 TRINITY_DN26927_c0_g1~~TRINITY_DN26927_c0_g1_i1.p1  ORF type:complete len:331 (+),score=119.88 TRINITY_DN26927_c0_g1_i1:103-1095(+)